MAVHSRMASPESARHFSGVRKVNHSQSIMLVSLSDQQRLAAVLCPFTNSCFVLAFDSPYFLNNEFFFVDFPSAAALLSAACAAFECWSGSLAQEIKFDGTQTLTYDLKQNEGVQLPLESLHCHYCLQWRHRCWMQELEQRWRT